MLDRWSTITWGQAIEPAAQIAEEGFMVSEDMTMGWKRRRFYPESTTLRDFIETLPEAARRIYLKDDGTPYEAGR